MTEPLERGPLEVDNWTPERLQSELEARLPALLQSYGAENNPVGWRDVALKLALEYHPAFKVKERSKIPVSGRPAKADRWMLRSTLRTRRDKLKKEAIKKGTTQRVEAEAARQVHAELKAVEDVARPRQRGNDTSNIIKTPSVGRLQNLINEPVRFPDELKSGDALFKTFLIASKIASKLPPA